MVKKKESVKISDIPESFQRYLDEIYLIARTKKGGWVSNKELSEHLDVKPASVSGMLEKLRENDFLCTLSSIYGINNPKKGLFRLKRVGIEYDDDLRLFRIKISGLGKRLEPIYSKLLK